MKFGLELGFMDATKQPKYGIGFDPSPYLIVLRYPIWSIILSQGSTKIKGVKAKIDSYDYHV